MKLRTVGLGFAVLLAACGEVGEVEGTMPAPAAPEFPLPDTAPEAQLPAELVAVEMETSVSVDEPAIDPVLAERPVRYVPSTGAVLALEEGLSSESDAPMLLPGVMGPELSRLTTQKVFGSDGRTLVADPLSWPARALVKIFVSWPNGKTGGCSGTMIGRKYVLTAGHCIYNPDRGGWAVSTRVVPGLDGTYMPFGSAWQVYFDTVKGWTEDRDSDYDYAMITLDRNLGDASGWLGLASLSDDSLDSLTAAVQGYPGDLAGGVRQYVHAGPIETYDSTMIYYDIDTMPGDSGAVLNGRSNFQDYTVGVHTGSSWFWAEEYNRATRINNKRYYQIQDWMNNRAGLGTVGGDHTSWPSTGGKTYTAPAAASFGGGRHDDFVRGLDGAVWHRKSTTGGWTSLGGSISDSPAVVSRMAGQLDLFVRGSDGALWTKALNGSTWWPAGTGWHRLGGNITGTPVAVSWGASRLDVFARGAGGDVVWYRWNGAWSGPTSLGGGILDRPAAVSWGTNRIDLAVRGLDGQVFHNWYDGVSWGGWSPTGGYTSTTPTIVAPRSGVLEIFVHGLDDAVWHRRYQAGWQGWQSLGGNITDEVAAVVRTTDQIDLFVRDAGGGVFTKAVNGSGSWWPGLTSWAWLGGDALGTPAVVSTAWNRLDVLVRGSDNVVRTRYWAGAGWSQ